MNKPTTPPEAESVNVLQIRRIGNSSGVIIAEGSAGADGLSKKATSSIVIEQPQRRSSADQAAHNDLHDRGDDDRSARR